MFWVISTALVLHGVIISRRGPMYQPCNSLASVCLAPLNNQVSFSMSSALNAWVVPTASTVAFSFWKNEII